MKDWKLIVKIVVGSVLLVAVMIFGLTKMSGGTSGLTADVNTLIDGARLVKENGETKITVVNFSDMECPACKVAHQQLKQLTGTSGVKYVVRHFPLGIHANSQVGARAVEAANEMDKGWEMIDVLFDKQSEWSGVGKADEKMVGYAVGLGLDEKTFREKLDSQEVKNKVKADEALVAILRLNGTPTIFVNGEQISPGFVMDKVNELLKK